MSHPAPQIAGEVFAPSFSWPLQVWRRLKKHRLALAGAAVFVLLILMAALAPWISPYNPDIGDYQFAFKTPGPGHWLGADEFGRDILSRIVHGARRSLAIAIMALLGPGLTKAMIAIGIVSIPHYARIIRGSILSVKENEFVQAARAMGSSTSRIIARHILPNVLAPIIVRSTLGSSEAILEAAALGFLGLGVTPPTSEWGAMLSKGREFLYQAPHIATFPGVAITITVLSLNLFGDGLRDALDPRLKE